VRTEKNTYYPLANIFFLKVKIYKCKFWVDELVHCIAFQHPLLANASDAAVCFVVETTLYISTHIFFTSSNFVIFYTSNRQQIFDMAPTLAYWDIRGVSVYYLFECHLIFYMYISSNIFKDSFQSRINLITIF